MTTFLTILAVLVALALAWLLLPIALGLLPFILLGWAMLSYEQVAVPLLAVAGIVVAAIALSALAERALGAILSWIYRRRA